MGATFDRPILARLRAAEEVEIETRAGNDAVAHRTVIWVVVDQRDRVFIRSVRGAVGRWYREAIEHPACVIVVGASKIPVDVARAGDPEQVAACSRALRAKYADDPSMRSMLRDVTLATTLRLFPR